MYYEAKIIDTASGNLSIHITEDVDWESFPKKATEFIEWTGGRILFRMGGSAERIWIVVIKWWPFFLEFDDFPFGMTLDSMISPCNSVVRDLHQHMKSAAA